VAAADGSSDSAAREPGALEPSPPAVGPPHSPVDPVPVTVPPPGPTRTRAGRDLPAAIGVGLVLAAAILASLYVEKAAFVGLLAVAQVVGLWELSNALRAGSIRLPFPPVAVGGIGMLVAGYRGGPEPLVVALVATAAAVLLWRLPVGGPGYPREVFAGTFAAVYVPFLAGFAALMVAADDGADRIVLFIVVTVCSDVGGYAAGVLFGRHPMAPSVSPKKSWEGFAGSAIACVACGTLAGPVLVGLSWWQGALLGIAVVATATLGDLGESMLKRDLKIKDMGSLLPGHGGLMDRLDSLLPTAPVAYLVLWVALGS
jgi:phosphatidate cytidylyltransferase